MSDDGTLINQSINHYHCLVLYEVGFVWWRKMED